MNQAMFGTALWEFHVPEKTKVIFVNDLFAEDYIGGAELTTEALYETAPESAFKIHSSSVTPELIKKYKDKYWIFVNFTQVKRDSFIELVNLNVRYSIIECDYKYCRFRSSHLHKLKTEQECACEAEPHGRFTYGIYKKAENVFFMSEKQREEYIKRFPKMANWSNTAIQSSTWSNAHIDMLLNLRQSTLERSDKWAILSGSSWIKNETECIKYCKTHDMEYDLIGGLSYHDFIHKLATYKGLVLMPAGFDTCPRLVVEARILGLELILNENVQHRDENWFASGSLSDMIEYLRQRTNYFWSKITL